MNKKHLIKREELIKTLYKELEHAKQLTKKGMDLQRHINIKLNNVRKEIEKENSNLIGKKAKCINVYNEQEYICICTSVKCLDDMSIKPLFKYKGKKIITELYEWI